MEYLKQLRRREMIEMSLKTIAAVLVGLVLIILMEGMIFGIYMNKIKENNETFNAKADCVVYCDKIGEDEYEVYVHNTVSGSWSIKPLTQTKEQIEEGKYGDVVYRAPNAFDVSIKGSHYIVMAIFIAGILGFFAWRFVKLNKEYTKLETKHQKLLNKASV
ncbi:MAG: hypothetical protein IJ371_06720 [Clostridia bacterium]|nr:hypothetical protein [Clostridia bacterium]